MIGQSPAFPVLGELRRTNFDGTYAGSLEPTDQSLGLTKREYFAGQALVGLISRLFELKDKTGLTGDALIKQIAEDCFKMADAMAVRAEQT